MSITLSHHGTQIGRHCQQMALRKHELVVLIESTNKQKRRTDRQSSSAQSGSYTTTMPLINLAPAHLMTYRKLPAQQVSSVFRDAPPVHDLLCHLRCSQAVYKHQPTRIGNRGICDWEDRPHKRCSPTREQRRSCITAVAGERSSYLTLCAA